MQPISQSRVTAFRRITNFFGLVGSASSAISVLEARFKPAPTEADETTSQLPYLLRLSDWTTTPINATQQSFHVGSLGGVADLLREDETIVAFDKLITNKVQTSAAPENAVRIVERTDFPCCGNEFIIELITEQRVRLRRYRRSKTLRHVFPSCADHFQADYVVIASIEDLKTLLWFYTTAFQGSIHGVAGLLEFAGCRQLYMAFVESSSKLLLNEPLHGRGILNILTRFVVSDRILSHFSHIQELQRMLDNPEPIDATDEEVFYARRAFAFKMTSGLSDAVEKFRYSNRIQQLHSLTRNYGHEAAPFRYDDADHATGLSRSWTLPAKSTDVVPQLSTYALSIATDTMLVCFQFLQPKELLAARVTCRNWFFMVNDQARLWIRHSPSIGLRHSGLALSSAWII